LVVPIFLFTFVPNKKKIMDNTMKEIISLCIRYHEMYMTERAVRNCDDMNSYEILVRAYELNKQIFDEQYKKVENLINKTK
jgi:hypothetical protein